MSISISYKDKFAIAKLSEYLLTLLTNHNIMGKEIIILCIGTDRCTGDSLGPLVGQHLSSRQIPHVHIFGTLSNPVHAKNLNETLAHINKSFTNKFVIAVDASLGSNLNVGNIILKEGSLSPGAALNKNLPKVGDLSFSGIVNISSSLDFIILQNTRLSLVYDQSKIISFALSLTLRKLFYNCVNK